MDPSRQGASAGQQESSSVFGSSPENPSASPFGSGAGITSSFGTQPGVPGAGSVSFGSTSNTGFNAPSSNASTFGATQRFHSSGMTEKPGFGQSSGSVFGTLSAASGFPSVSASPSSTPGFSTGNASASFGSSSSNPSVSGFGTNLTAGTGFGGNPFSNMTKIKSSPAVTAATTPAFGVATSTPVFGTLGTGGPTGLGAGRKAADFGAGMGFKIVSSGASPFGAGAFGASGFPSTSAQTPSFGSVPSAGSGFGGTGITGFASVASSASSSGFGSVTSSSTGFGTGSSVFTGLAASKATTPGFGAATTVSPGAGQTGFAASTSNAGTSGFSNLTSTSSSVTSPGFGTGSAGSGNTGLGAESLGSTAFGSTSTSFSFRSGSSAFGAQSSASSGFGKGPVVSPGMSAQSAAGFKTSNNDKGGAFGDSSSVFASSARQPASGLFAIPPSTQTAPASTFGGVSAPATSGSRSVSGSSSVFSHKSGSVFGQTSSTAPGSDGASQTQKMTASSAGSTRPTPSVFGGTTAFGVATSTSALTVGSTAPALGAAAGALRASSLFGGASRTPTSTTEASGAFDPKSTSFPPTSSSGLSSVFGKGPQSAGSASSPVSGDAFKTSAGSVFGGAGRVVKQDPSVGTRPTLFPAAARMTSAGGMGSASHSQRALPSRPSGEGLEGDSRSTQPASTASLFPAKPSSVFGGQPEGTAGSSAQSSSVFGGRQSSSQSQGGIFAVPPAVFPVASTGSSVKAEPSHSQTEVKEASDEEPSDSVLPDRVQSKPSRRGKRLGRIGEAEPSTSESATTAASTFTSVFGVKRPQHARTMDREQPQETRTPETIRQIRRSSSLLEDISSKTSIACKGISANLNKGSILRSHFSRFGKVRSVRPVPAKRYAIIQFETHEEAAAAKKHGTVLSKREKPLSIFWRSSGSDRSPSLTEETALAGKVSPPGASRTGRGGSSDREESLAQKYSLPSSVAAELASMSGADSDTSSTSYRVVDRPLAASRTEVKSRKGTGQREKSKAPSASLSKPSTAVMSSPVKESKMDAVSVSSLRKLVATTTMEKVNVLDMRDKLLRQKSTRHAGGRMDSEAFVGACPDMCPEKERLYREEVRRLSLYEIIPGSSTLTGSTSLVDHARAVKEYSRSSADQDEPLPHELRPLPVLTMTMNYLLVEIADRGEDGKWAEWYDFLWNRTRSIRKEITQQQLLSMEVVELLEKCVRFHIYCSERLCMEDMMVFDSKINNENLTKCLQTLKELYADMEMKHGILCPNEAEFRAYMVLMNLNEGDTLREVQQLRLDVRESAEIVFAVKAYASLNSNNYVRFFRLVKLASFLNACVLHRYFNQVRARALEIMLRAYTAGQKTVRFPVRELIRILAFESEGMVREFCSYYGLQVDGADLLLDRSTFVEPETSLPSWRTVGLIESKRMVSVGEVINGGLLPPLQLPTPQCSFDERGRFIGHLDDTGESDGGLERVKPFSVKSVPKPSLLQPGALHQFSDADTESSGSSIPPAVTQQKDAAAVAKQQQLLISNEAVKMIARELFWEVIDESVGTLAQSLIRACGQVMACDVSVKDDIIKDVTSQLIREVSSEVIDAEREHQSRQEEEERVGREARVADSVLEALVQDTVDTMAAELATTQWKDAEAQALAERQERCSQQITEDLLGDVTMAMGVQVADEVHQVDVVQRLQLLADLQKALELKRTSQWLAIWRRALMLRQRQKRAMLDFPCAPPMQSARDRLRSIFPDRPEKADSLLVDKSVLLLNERAQMTVLSPLEVEQRALKLTAHLSLASLVAGLRRATAWQPLNLASLLRAPVLHCVQHWPLHPVSDFLPHGVQWKLLLSLPGKAELGVEGGVETPRGKGLAADLMPTLCHWLQAKFTHGEASNSSKTNVLSQYSVELASSGSGLARLRLGVCVRNVPEFSRKGKEKPPSAEEAVAITKGTSAILFLLPPADTGDDTKWLSARLRLARLLEAKPLLPAVPLVLLLPSSTTLTHERSDELSEMMGISGFQGQGLIADTAVVELPISSGVPADTTVATQELNTQVREAVKFLASRLPDPPELTSERLGEVVEKVLTQHFFNPVLQDLKLRQQRGKLHQAPNRVIGLYNSVLDHVALALASPSLQDVSWPAPELVSPTATGLPDAEWNSKKRQADIYELVANLRLPWFHHKDQSATAWSYVCLDVWAFVSAVVKKRCDSAVSLTTRISNLLARTCQQFENVCSLTQNEDLCTPTYVNAPWTDIILACVDFRLQRLYNWKEEDWRMGGDVEVYYEEEDMSEFEPPGSWVQALLDTEDLESHRLQDTVEQAALQHMTHRATPQADNLCISFNNNTNNDDDSMEEDEDDGNSSGVPVDSAGRDNNSDGGARLSNVSCEEVPENMRPVFSASFTLRQRVEEERQQAMAFERYLLKALNGGTTAHASDMASPIFSATPDGSRRPLMSQTHSASPPMPDRRVGTPVPDRQMRTYPVAGLSTLADVQPPSVSTAGLGSNVYPSTPMMAGRKRQWQNIDGAAMEEEEGAVKHRRDHSLSLNDSLEEFRDNLQSQRLANSLFEKRLRSYMES